MDINYSALDCYNGFRIGHHIPRPEAIIFFEKSLRVENPFAKDQIRIGSGYRETLGKTTL
jgi:hypothetical protein